MNKYFTVSICIFLLNTKILLSIRRWDCRCHPCLSVTFFRRTKIGNMILWLHNSLYKHLLLLNTNRRQQRLSSKGRAKLNNSWCWKKSCWWTRTATNCYLDDICCCFDYLTSHGKWTWHWLERSALLTLLVFLTFAWQWKEGDVSWSLNKVFETSFVSLFPMCFGLIVWFAKCSTWTTDALDKLEVLFRAGKWYKC